MSRGGHIPPEAQREYAKHVNRSQLHQKQPSAHRHGGLGNILDPYSSVGIKRNTVDMNLHRHLSHQITDPMFSPLFATNVSQAPPTFLHVAEFDVLRDEGLLYAKKLRDNGVQVTVHYSKGGVHGEITKVGSKYCEFRLGEIALEKMYEFVNRTLGVGQSN